MPFCMVNDDIIRTNAEIKIRIRNIDIRKKESLLYSLEYVAGTEGNRLGDIQLAVDFSKQKDRKTGEMEAVGNGYREILLRTAEYEYDSIELPLLWNPESALSCPETLELAQNIILDFLDYYDYTIYLVVPFYQNLLLGEECFHDLSDYVDKKYTPREALFEDSSVSLGNGQRIVKKILENDFRAGTSGLATLNSLDELASRLEAPFVTQLFRFIDERNMTDVEVYKKAMIDRKLFSKIRKGNGYTPRKDTIVALAISMKLNVDETQELLRSAGYVLTDSSKFDLIIGYFIGKKDYDIFKINEALYKYGLNGLGYARN